MIPFGDFAPDSSDYNQELATVANNVIPASNKYLPLLSLQEQTDALTGTCKGATKLEDSDGNNYTYAGDATKLYSISGTTVTDESKVGGYTDNTEFWNFVRWGEQVVASKWGDTPQVLTFGASTFADLGGTPPQARAMAVVRDFLVMGNTFDATDGGINNRVWWSGFQDITSWTPGTNQSDNQDLQGVGGAVKAIFGGEFGIVLMENSIWRMDYVGAPLVFEFNEIEPGRGTPAERSAVKYGSDVYYLGQDGFYALRNGARSEPIGAGRVDTYFSDLVNNSYLENVIGAVDKQRGLVVWAFPTDNSADGTPDKLLIYSIKFNRWSTADIDLDYLFSGASTALTLEDLDSFGDLDTLEASLDSEVWKGGLLQLTAFSTNNKLAFFSGTTLEATIETGEFFDETGMTYVSSVRPFVDGACCAYLSSRYLLSDTPTWTAEVSIDGQGKFPFRSNNKFHRVRVKTSGDFDQAVGINLDAKRIGNR